MALILNIDTATEHASVCISNNGEMLALKYCDVQKDHASFLHVAIKSLFEETGLTSQAIDAVAITSGPGSYTGLRVSMAAAKGFCYALDKPLIAINTLEVMAFAAKKKLLETARVHETALLCPMIDARRMEVFTAVYDLELNTLLTPRSLILEENFLAEWHNNLVYFFGSGAAKVKTFGMNNAIFVDCRQTAEHLGKLSIKSFEQKTFADIAYLEPNYLKDFHSTAK